MEGFILELSLEVGHLQRAIEDLERHEDIYNDAKRTSPMTKGLRELASNSPHQKEIQYGHN